jgi:hypothetical protein
MTVLKQITEENICIKMDKLNRKFILHRTKFRALYRPPVIVRVVESRRLRWTGHVEWKMTNEGYMQNKEMRRQH